MNKIPTCCPSCTAQLAVRSLACEACGTEVSGSYGLTSLHLLDPSDQEFVQSFILSSGSLKEMASILGVSYPTVRNRLNAIIDQLQIDKPDTER